MANRRTLSVEAIAPAQRSLEFPRRKPRSLVASVLHRVSRAAQLIFGETRTLGPLLDLAWLLRRLAFECCGEVYGQSFHCAALALSTDTLKRWLPIDASVIDIGCGQGRWSREAGKYARCVLGVDRDEANLRVAKAQIQATNVSFALQDAFTALKEKRFDAALLIHVLEHIDDADRLLLDLREAGVSRVIIEVPDFSAEPLNAARLDLRRSFHSDADHVREYTLEILHEQLHRGGWALKETIQRGGAICGLALSA